MPSRLLAPGGHSIAVDRNMTFGESADNSVPIRGGFGLAPHQFEIVVDVSGACALCDRSPDRSTLLNGKPIEKPTPLKNGDKVTCGNLELEFEGTSPVELPREADSPPPVPKVEQPDSASASSSFSSIGQGIASAKPTKKSRQKRETNSSSSNKRKIAVVSVGVVIILALSGYQQLQLQKIRETPTETISKRSPVERAAIAKANKIAEMYDQAQMAGWVPGSEGVEDVPSAIRKLISGVYGPLQGRSFKLHGVSEEDIIAMEVYLQFSRGYLRVKKEYRGTMEIAEIPKKAEPLSNASLLATKFLTAFAAGWNPGKSKDEVVFALTQGVKGKGKYENEVFRVKLNKKEIESAKKHLKLQNNALVLVKIPDNHDATVILANHVVKMGQIAFSSGWHLNATASDVSQFLSLLAKGGKGVGRFYDVVFQVPMTEIEQTKVAGLLQFSGSWLELDDPMTGQRKNLIDEHAASLREFKVVILHAEDSRVLSAPKQQLSRFRVGAPDPMKWERIENEAQTEGLLGVYRAFDPTREIQAHLFVFDFKTTNDRQRAAFMYATFIPLASSIINEGSNVDTWVRSDPVRVSECVFSQYIGFQNAAGERIRLDSISSFRDRTYLFIFAGKHPTEVERMYKLAFTIEEDELGDLLSNPTLSGGKAF